MKNTSRIFLQKVQISDTEKELIRELWNMEYPESMFHVDPASFENYLNSLQNPEHVLVYNQDQLEAWYVSFERENAFWFAMILSATAQGQGLGRKILEHTKPPFRRHGWVIDTHGYRKKNGEPYRSPLEFYQKCGFTIGTERLELPQLSAVMVYQD